ncbi:MAG: cation:proton antiporter [Planctomycetes bacterium]|nr:cation:proton antiporter [Planctomycetota bacterium]
MLLSSSSLELTAVGFTILVLFVSSLVALAPLKKLRVPLTVALMLVGFGAGALVNTFGEHEPGAFGEILGFLAAGGRLTPELILFVLLPPLVYESAFNLDVRALGQNMPAIVTLAVPALIVSTVVVGAAVMLGGGASHGLTWPAALLFGALISATDPVAVVALFKELGAPKRLGVLVEGESLMNDGTAIVLFNLLLAAVVAGVLGTGNELSIGGQVLGGVGSFLVVALGGIAVGVILAFPIFWLIGWIVSNESVEISLSVVLAYASFVIAEHFLHVSGVLAAVTAGLIAGSFGKTKVSPSVAEFMHSFWEYMAFAMNSLIFFSVGLIIARQVPLDEVKSLLPLLAVTLVAVIGARALGVFASVPLINRLVDRISLAYQAVMWWGGLRGAVSLALALTVFAYVDVPQPGGGTASLPSDLRHTVLILSAGVVFFTLLVNALTMQPLIRKLGLDAPTLRDRFAQAFAERDQIHKVVKALERLEDEGGVLPQVLKAQRERLEARRVASEESLAGLREELATPAGEKEAAMVAARVAIGIERGNVLHRFAGGELSEAATKALLSELDQIQDRIQHHGTLPDERTSGRTGGFGAALLSKLEPLPLLGALARNLWKRRLAVAVEASRGLFLVTRTVEKTLAEIEEEGILPQRALAMAQLTYARWRHQAKTRLSRLTADFPEYAESSQEQFAELQLLRVESHTLEHLAESGLLTDKARATGRLQIREREEALRDLRATGLELDNKSLLRQVPALRDASEDVLTRLASLLVSRTLPEGEILVKEGDRGDSMYMIARGCVEVLTHNEEGVEVPLSTLSAGTSFGELALLLGGPRRATVRALSPVNLLELKRNHVQDLFDERPDFAEILKASIYPRAIGRALVDCAALKALSASQREELALAFRLEEHQDGDAVIGEEHLHLCYVCEGTLRSGSETVTSGEMAGVGTLAGVCEPWTAEGPVRVLYLPPDAWSKFQVDHPATADACRKAAGPPTSTPT